jgi:hypothetical protein
MRITNCYTPQRPEAVSNGRDFSARVNPRHLLPAGEVFVTRMRDNSGAFCIACCKPGVNAAV